MNILITGAHGFVGYHVTKLLKERLFDHKIFTPKRSELDLRIYHEIIQYLSKHEITHIVHLAARVGGIGANKRFPADFFFDNSYFALNLLHAIINLKFIEQFINIGTICQYPKFAPIPLKENDLWNGYPEETNAPYGIAKRATMEYAKSINQQYGINVVNLMPVNMMGEKDKFDPIYSHVVPAIILKIDKAVKDKSNEVHLWGTGKATREFLYAGDFAEAILMSLHYYGDPDPINIGTGKDICIKDLSNMIKNIMCFKGDLIFTGQISDGQPFRKLDINRAKEKLGFEAKTSLEKMLDKTINYYYDLKSKNPKLIDEYMTMIY
jgi:GDP-L-fucose synthase